MTSCLILGVWMAAPAAAEDTTADLLEAPRVRNRLAIRTSTAAGLASAEAALQFSVADDEFEPLAPGMTLAGGRAVSLVYPSLNPLALDVSVATELSDDPNFRQLADALDKLVGLPKIAQLAVGDVGTSKAGPTAFAGPPVSCERLQRIRTRLTCLAKSFAEAHEIATRVPEWSEQVDADPGPGVVANVRGEILKKVERLDELTARAKQVIQLLQAGGEQIGDPATPALACDVGGRKDTQPDQCSAEGLAILAVVEAVRIGDSALQLSRVARTREGLTQLHQALAPYADANRWRGREYILATLQPRPEKTIAVTVQAVPILYGSEEGVLKVQRDEKNKVTGRFLLRRQSSLVPEVAIGAVVSGVRVPVYGTRAGANGTTLVTRASHDPASFSAALLLNAVCRCGLSSFAYPMLQIGISSSDAAPALMAGAGLRFVRPRKVGIAAGAVLAFPKDLNKLAIDGPVTGTAEIQADLTRRATVKGYFAIQYSF